MGGGVINDTNFYSLSIYFHLQCFSIVHIGHSCWPINHLLLVVSKSGVCVIRNSLRFFISLSGAFVCAHHSKCIDQPCKISKKKKTERLSHSTHSWRTNAISFSFRSLQNMTISRSFVKFRRDAAARCRPCGRWLVAGSVALSQWRWISCFHCWNCCMVSSSAQALSKRLAAAQPFKRASTSCSFVCVCVLNKSFLCVRSP